MVVIDFHSHLGKSDKLLNFQSKKEVTIDDVVQEQAKSGIDFSVALPLPLVYPDDIQRNNELMMSLGSIRLFPFVWLNPYFLKSNDARGQDESQLINSIKSGKVYGIKVHPVCDGYYPEPLLMTPIMEIARATRLPILWHTGWAAIGGSGSFGEARYVEYSAEAFPDVTTVIGHLVDPNAPDIARRRDNVYLETSYCAGPRRLAGIVNQVGSERVLFGSDYPVNNPRFQKTLVLEAGLSDKDTEKILGQNASRLLNIKT